jgi:hypothetical protein
MGHIEHICGDIVNPVIHAELAARGTACPGLAGQGNGFCRRRGRDAHTGNRDKDNGHSRPAGHGKASYAEQCPGCKLADCGDFIGQAEVAVALPVVEKYLAEAVVPGGVVERPGRGSLILKEWIVFDGGCFGLLCDGHLYAMIARVTI